MATYAVTAGHKALGPWSLTASQVDTVTFADNVSKVAVINDGSNTADVWVTYDGATNPVVPSAGASTAALRVPPNSVLTFTLSGSADEVRLVSSGTPSVSVQLDP